MQSKVLTSPYEKTLRDRVVCLKNSGQLKRHSCVRDPSSDEHRLEVRHQGPEGRPLLRRRREAQAQSERGDEGEREHNRPQRG